MQLPIKGMSVDNEPLKQDKGYATFVLNGLNDSKEGSTGSLINDEGNTLCFSLPAGYKIVGHCTMDNNEVAIFSTNNVYSEIGIVQQCNYTTYVNSACLNFSDFIQASYRYRRGGDKTIYFVDGVNPDRYFIFDREETFYTTDYQLYLNSGGNPDTYIEEKWDCDLFSMNLVFTRPTVNLIEIGDESGNLPTGSFSLYFFYIDRNNNEAFFHNTEEVCIYKDNYTTYDDIEGNYNHPDFPIEMRGVSNTSKTYTYRLSNIDTSFDKIKIIASYKRSGDGITTVNYLVDTINITSSTIDYTFNKLDEFTIITDEELTIEYSKYKSRVITQSNNRLIKGNLIEPNSFDRYTLQQIANQARVTYVTSALKVDDIYENTAASKSPITYDSQKSFMRDEIYDIVIQFEDENGNLSEFFHIPGRAKDLYPDGTPMPLAIDDPHQDNTILPVNPTNGRSNREVVTTLDPWDSCPISPSDNTCHLSGNLERWEVYNTAIRTFEDRSAISGPDDHMDIYTRGVCSYFQSDELYPDIRNEDGNRIYPEGYVRYHKMPDATLEPIYKGIVNDTAPEGDSTWGSIGLPDSLRYIIPLHVEVDNINLPPGINSYRIGFRRLNSVISKGYFMDDGEFVGSLNVEEWWSANGLFGSKSADTDIGIYWSAETVFSRSGVKSSNYIKFENEYFTERDDFTTHNNQLEIVDTPLGSFNHNYSGIVTEPLYNRCILDYAFLNPTESSIMDTRTGVQTITNSRAYNRVYITFSDYDALSPVNGNTYVNLSLAVPRAYYVGFKSLITPKLDEEAITNYESNFYQSLHRTAGDVLITKLRMERQNSTLHTYGYCETKINAELYHVTDIEEDGIDEYRYNHDFTVYGAKKAYNVVSRASLVSGSTLFRNRLIWSEVSYQNDFRDFYLLYKANDFQDITDGTSINLLEEVDNRTLAVCSEKNFYRIPINAQELQLDGITAILGTGSFLSTPPSKASFSEYGFGGTQGVTSVCKSEIGLTWLDHNNGKVFNYSGEMSVLSNIHMSSFFRDHLEYKADIHFKEQLGIQHPALGKPYGPYSLVTFEPYYDRIIIHKRDWLPVFNYTIYDSNISYSPGEYVYDLSDHKYKVATTLTTLNPLDNSSFFINKSYTISFSKGNWTSFHSFLPDYMFNDGRSLFTSLNNQVWRHGSSNFQTYYGTKYDYIVEFVVSNPQTTDLHSVQWVGEILRYNDTSDQWQLVKDISFDRIWVYTNNKSTGVLTLEFDDDYYSNIVGFSPRIDESDGNYKVSRLRDYLLSTNTPSTTDWSDISANYYIDKLPTTVTPSSYYLDPPIKSKWFKVRLYFNNPENLKIITELIDTKFKPSIR